MGIIDNCRDLAEELCRYSRLCYDRRLVGAAGGNLSVRADKKDVFLVTASGVSLRDVAPENIVVVDVDGNVLEAPAGLKPSKEIGFHLAIFKVRPQTNAVLHVHPAYSTIYANTRRAIPPATVSANLKLKQGRIVLEARPGSQELSGSITTAVQEASQEVTVLLLERHGLIAFNSSLCNAFDDAELAEDTAKIAFMSSHLPAEAAVSTGKIVDLTAPLDEKTHCYPTDPPFKKNWHITFDKNGMNLSKLEMSAHSGTHVDAPLHFIPGDMDIVSMGVDRFMGPAIAIDCPKQPGQNILPLDFADSDIRPGDIVLFRTGWEERSCSPRFFEGDWPGLSVEAVEALIDKKVNAIGGDIPSADNPSGFQAGAVAHTKAMVAGIPIFEGLVNLKEIVGRRFYFIGLPLKLMDCEASPVRAVALLDNTEK